MGRNDGSGRGVASIMTDYHWEPSADPLGGSDPHDWCGALDLDDPKLKLSQQLTLANICEGRIHRLFDHRPRSKVSKKTREKVPLALGTSTSSE